MIEGEKEEGYERKKEKEREMGGEERKKVSD